MTYRRPPKKEDKGVYFWRWMVLLVGVSFWVGIIRAVSEVVGS